MKFQMNPARAYLLGLWKGRRTKEGVGVEGRRELCEVFLKACLDEKLAQPDKVKFEQGKGSKCYFYNSAVRAWLEDELSRRDERLRYRNDYAASYFAGLFDSKGGFFELNGERFCYFVGDRTDELVLLRLGFRVKNERGKIAVISRDFYGWISPHLRLSISRL
ncbi:MAG: hypothetical protein N3E51_04495 [Candidatus Micrarchaeota archaeon]|nr:hypothetical protein [Candidatus Micrarchaeota archaeon]